MECICISVLHRTLKRIWSHIISYFYLGYQISFKSSLTNIKISNKYGAAARPIISGRSIIVLLKGTFRLMFLLKYYLLIFQERTQTQLAITRVHLISISQSIELCLKLWRKWLFWLYVNNFLNLINIMIRSSMVIHFDLGFGLLICMLYVYKGKQLKSNRYWK